MKFKLKYDSTEERFEALKQIETLVQEKAKTPEEQGKKRREIVQKNPEIFYALYHDYQMTPERKRELKNIAGQCIDRLALNSDLTNEILTFKGKTLEEKTALCAKIVSWLSRDSGVEPFSTGVAKTRFEIGEDKELAGYHTQLAGDSNGMERLIWMNQEDLEKANTPSEIMDTLFHEALHSTQYAGSDSFEHLSKKYYVSSILTNPKKGRYNPEWVGKVDGAYLNQPCEKEAWFFGQFIQDCFNDNELFAQQQRTAPEIQRVARTLTGNADCTWKQDRGRLHIQFKDKIKSTYTPQKLAQHIGYMPDMSKRDCIDIPLEMNTDFSTIFKQLTQRLTALSQDTKSQQGGLSGYLQQTQQPAQPSKPEKPKSDILQSALKNRGNGH